MAFSKHEKCTYSDARNLHGPKPINQEHKEHVTPLNNALTKRVYVDQVYMH
jgi:hypothetical protein